jgi:hypothetical protein
MRSGLRVLRVFSPTIAAAVFAAGTEAQQPPPLALHVGHVTSGFPGAPGGRGLVVTASQETNTAMMHANFAAGDSTNLDYMKTHAQHVLYALDPQQGTQGPGLGYGVKQALETSITHATNAMNAEGASESVKTHGAGLVRSAQAVLARVTQMTEIANQVIAARNAAEAAPFVAELRRIALQLDTGTGSPGAAVRDGMTHVEDEAYSLLIGEGHLRVLH